MVVSTIAKDIGDYMGIVNTSLSVPTGALLVNNQWVVTLSLNGGYS
jgi:hypothetical protein